MSDDFKYGGLSLYWDEDGELVVSIDVHNDQALELLTPDVAKSVLEWLQANQPCDHIWFAYLDWRQSTTTHKICIECGVKQPVDKGKGDD